MEIRVGQPPRIGEHDDGLVKFEIFPGIPLDIFFAVRFFKTLNAGLQSCQISPGHLLGGQIGRKTFEVLADQEEFVDVFFREPDDERAPLRERSRRGPLLQAG